VALGGSGNEALVAGGPDSYWSDSLSPSRGQWRDIAQLACEVLGIPVPTTRLEATTAQVRLRSALQDSELQGGGSRRRGDPSVSAGS
jgi:hypothetical protein